MHFDNDLWLPVSSESSMGNSVDIRVTLTVFRRSRMARLISTAPSG